MVFDGFGGFEAHFGSLEELLAELLTGWMAAGWLTGWLLLAGWLAGHRDPRIQSTRSGWGKWVIHGWLQQPFCKTSGLEYYKIQGYKAIKLERLHMLQDYQIGKAT